MGVVARVGNDIIVIVFVTLITLCQINSVLGSSSGLLAIGDCFTYNDSVWSYEWCHGKSLHRRDASLALSNLISLGNPVEKSNDATVFQSGDACTASLLYTSNVTLQCCYNDSNRNPSSATTFIHHADDSTTCHINLLVCTMSACSIKTQIKEMFYFSYQSYLKHAFPLGNLKPISCTGEHFELGRLPMVTLIDTLDMLGILRDSEEFQNALSLIVEHTNFDINVEVSVFEITIRVLGGLLSGHVMATTDSIWNLTTTTYNNELLILAVDLADRLLPAFDTATGIPFGTVNLQWGVPVGETPVASTAGAGSLSLEFTILSQLTGNSVYQDAATRAVKGIYDRRSKLGLVGKHIDTATGEWVENNSGPGSNSDSFYEYMYKMYVLTNDKTYLNMFTTLYDAILAYNKHGDWYVDVSMFTGCPSTPMRFESLSAFFPGLQILKGDIGIATKTLNAIYSVWKQKGFLPEAYDILKSSAASGFASAAYPLRPELIESTYYAFLATRDSSWKEAATDFLMSIQSFTRTSCGFASVANVETKMLEDTMPSFFLSETLKYLYLIFDEENLLNDSANEGMVVVFTTEAHPFIVSRSSDSSTCEAAAPVLKTPVNNRYDRKYNAVLQMNDNCKKKKSSAVAANKEKQEEVTVVNADLFDVTTLVDGFRIIEKSKRTMLQISNLGSSIILFEHDKDIMLYKVEMYDTRQNAVISCRVLNTSCSIAVFGSTKRLVSEENKSAISVTGKLFYNNLGCSTTEAHNGTIWIVDRGTCLFYEKAKVAQSAGAVALIIVNYKVDSIMMKNDEDSNNRVILMSGAEDMKDDDIMIPVVMVPHSSKEELLKSGGNDDEIVDVVVGKEMLGTRNNEASNSKTVLFPLSHIRRLDQKESDDDSSLLRMTVKSAYGDWAVEFGEDRTEFENEGAVVKTFKIVRVSSVLESLSEDSDSV